MPTCMGVSLLFWMEWSWDVGMRERDLLGLRWCPRKSSIGLGSFRNGLGRRRGRHRISRGYQRRRLGSPSLVVRASNIR